MVAALLQLQGLQQLLHGLESSREKSRQEAGKQNQRCLFGGALILRDLAAWRTVPWRHSNKAFPFNASSNVPPETFEDKTSEAQKLLGSFYLRSRQYSGVASGDDRQHLSCEEEVGGWGGDQEGSGGLEPVPAPSGGFESDGQGLV